MSYSYEKEKPHIFTDDGQRQFLKVRDFAHKTLAVAGAVQGWALIEAAGSGDSWKMMACIDRLVELGELREIPTGGAWQHRVFVSGRAE